MALVRMRTKKEAFKMLKLDDPNTAITEHALYIMMRSGQVPCIRVGAKRLVNYDALIEHLNMPTRAETEPPKLGVIRRLG